MEIPRCFICFVPGHALHFAQSLFLLLRFEATALMTSARESGFIVSSFGADVGAKETQLSSSRILLLQEYQP
jgi:hypothetical protein